MDADASSVRSMRTRNRAAAKVSLVDTEGLVHPLHVHPDKVQDRDSAHLLLGDKPKENFPRMQNPLVGSDYAGRCKYLLEEKSSWEAERAPVPTRNSVVAS